MIEAIGGGTDLVNTTIDGLMLAANVENLTVLGSSGLHAVGNKLNNVITGNSGQNSITAGDGNDTLDGGLDADNLLGNKATTPISSTMWPTRCRKMPARAKTRSLPSVDDYTLELDQEIEILTLTGGGDLDANGKTLPTSSTEMPAPTP